MHEAKGDVKMEIQMTPLQRSLIINDSSTNKKSDRNSPSPHVVISTNGNGNNHRNNNGTGEESSDDESMIQVPPKKNRLLKESHHNNNLSSQIICNSTIQRSSPIPILQLSNGNGIRKDIIADEQNNHPDEEDDDEDVCNLSIKEGGVSNSFTSGDNSDAEVGPDGDESNGSDMKQEDSRKVFECDVCNMKFSNGANMRRHRMRHSGIKPYECKICKKRFFRKDHLAEHMATHSKLLPFRCPICNKGFQRQIAMRAHFQNEHVGGSHEMVKACPLCSFKAGSMKSLRVHFYSRHGIDLDNPMPHSPSLLISGNGERHTPSLNGNGEYSELAHALGFEDREKSSDSIIPSHFLVPQIEISSTPSFTSHFPFPSDSYYNFAQDERHNSNSGGSSSPNISPQSDRSSNVPSSIDLTTVIVKKEVLDEHHLSSPEHALRIVDDPHELLNNKSLDIPDDVQDSPEDLSSRNSKLYSNNRSAKPNIRRNRTTLNDGKVKWKHFLNKRSSHNPKTNAFSIVKISPLKSLLRDDTYSSCEKEKSQDQNTTTGTNHNITNFNGSKHNINGSTNNVSKSGRSTSTTCSISNINNNNNNSTHSGQSSSNTFLEQSYEGEEATNGTSGSNHEGSSSANNNNTTNGNGIENSTASHSRLSRRGFSIPNLNHQCVYCGIIFPDKTLYFLHKGCHSDSNPWRCNICGEFCYNVYDFNSHLLSKSHQ